MNRLVAGMEELIRRTIGPTITVETVEAARLRPAYVDASQLESALLNLCIIARDAMPDGGRITIETANKWMDRAAARQHDMLEGQYLSLCVTDTGTGMSPEVKARAFDPFFTTKPIGQGTGLGLSMIYGFAKQTGGQVRIYSEEGQGTTVCIYLPRHHGSAEGDEPETFATEQVETGQGETVLVVDDEPTVRMLVTDVLEELGYSAIEATVSATGLKLLQSNTRIDLLVTDVGLPGGMNGRQMADAASAYDITGMTAENLSPTTAAGVQIDGVLIHDGRTIATSQATIDYLPGHSKRQGGLFFEEDPQAHDLELRALGYSEP